METTGSPTGAIDAEELRGLARALQTVLRELHLLASTGASGLAGVVESHLGTDPRALPVLTHEFAPGGLVDMQVALDAWPSLGAGREASVVGITGEQRRFHPLSELLNTGGAFGVGIGPVDYIDLPDSPTTTRSCVHFGLFLLRDGGRSAGVLLRGPDAHGPLQQARLEVITPEAGYGQQLLAEIRELAVERSVLRGAVIGLGEGIGQHYGALRFMARPTMTRAELVLPDRVLATIEAHVMGVAAHRDRLRAAGQHLKRGVLLYGPPGTGKTHTVRYLLGQLPGVTALVLSGQALMGIGFACTLARLFQPSLVILEDVDLIARDRSFMPIGANPFLSEVLNQIDGLGDDVDVTFLLTTNRVDVVERALSERPGRVDVAVEIAPPDEDGRARLFRLYGAGLGLAEMPDAELAPAVAVTAGRTATFLREAVRRGALEVALRSADGPLRLDGQTLAAAATELLADRSALTRAVLAGATQPDAEPPMHDAGVARPATVSSAGFGGYAPAPVPPPFAPGR